MSGYRVVAPVVPCWGSTPMKRWPPMRVKVVDDGTYLAQHVGPASAYELIEWFLGPLHRVDLDRVPKQEVAAATTAGVLRHRRTVVYNLRKCVWRVPDFTVERYRGALKRLDARIRKHGAFVAHSTRTPPRSQPPTPVNGRRRAASQCIGSAAIRARYHGPG